MYTQDKLATDVCRRSCCMLSLGRPYSCSRTHQRASRPPDRDSHISGVPPREGRCKVVGSQQLATLYNHTFLLNRSLSVSISHHFSSLCDLLSSLIQEISAKISLSSLSHLPPCSPPITHQLILRQIINLKACQTKRSSSQALESQAA
jgi:hypothetical protein